MKMNPQRKEENNKKLTFVGLWNPQKEYKKTRQSFTLNMWQILILIGIIFFNLLVFRKLLNCYNINKINEISLFYKTYELLFKIDDKIKKLK